MKKSDDFNPLAVHCVEAFCKIVIYESVYIIDHLFSSEMPLFITLSAPYLFAEITLFVDKLC